MLLIKVIKPSIFYVNIWTFNLLSVNPLIKYKKVNIFKWLTRKEKKSAMKIYTFKQQSKEYCPLSIDEIKLKYVKRFQPFHEYDLF
jgi:hypothetical protein